MNTNGMSGGQMANVASEVTDVEEPKKQKRARAVKSKQDEFIDKIILQFDKMTPKEFAEKAVKEAREARLEEYKRQIEELKAYEGLI